MQCGGRRRRQPSEHQLLTVVLILILAVLVYIAYRLTPKKRPTTRSELLARAFSVPMSKEQTEALDRQSKALLAEAKALGAPNLGSWGELQEWVVAHRKNTDANSTGTRRP